MQRRATPPVSSSRRRPGKMKGEVVVRLATSAGADGIRLGALEGADGAETVRDIGPGKLLLVLESGEERT